MKLSVKKISESTGHRSPIYGLCSYKPGTFLTGGSEGWIAEWKLSNPENAKLFATVPTSIFSIYFLEEEDIVIAGDRDGGLHWIDNEKKSKDVFAHRNGVYGIIKSGEVICTFGGDGYLSFWDINTQTQLESIQISSSALRSIILNPIGLNLFIGGSDGYIYDFDLRTNEVKSSVKAHKGTVFSLGISPNSDLLSGGKDALLKAHRVINLETIRSINAHWFAIYSIKINPNNLIFATASRDKTIRLWSTFDLSPILTIDYADYQGHVRSVNNLLWIENGKYLISVSDDTKMIIWEVETIE